MGKDNILEVLGKRPVVGDGSYVTVLERRGYVKAGPFTPEAVLEYPEAVTQLHRDFMRAGAEVLQTLTFHANDGKLSVVLADDSIGTYDGAELNQKACDLAKNVAKDGDVWVCGGISPTPSYNSGKCDKDKVKAEFRKQAEIFMKNDIDFFLAEFFFYMEEMEWAIEVLREFKKPVAASMCIGPVGDYNGIPPGECAVHMARAGADIVGVNCCFDPFTELKVLREMKKALDSNNLNPFLLMQPVAFHCPDVEHDKYGYAALPEFPLALEPRLLTRWDVRKFVREGYELGVRYFGGCCGFEPYHIREMAEELTPERGFRMPGVDKQTHWGDSLTHIINPRCRTRVGDHWRNLVPTTGRPLSAAFYQDRQSN